MANSLFYGEQLAGVRVNALRVGNTKAAFDQYGVAEVDPTDTDLVTSIQKQGAGRVDKEGTEEALTAGVVQTATTLSAIVFRNGAAQTVLNIRDTNGSGTLVYGPLTIAANAERVIVFPTQVTVSGGVFIDVDSGGLNATPGFLIP